MYIIPDNAVTAPPTEQKNIEKGPVTALSTSYYKILQTVLSPLLQLQLFWWNLHMPPARSDSSAVAVVTVLHAAVGQKPAAHVLLLLQMPSFPSSCHAAGSKPQVVQAAHVLLLLASAACC
jgi:hypothetical protein